MEPTQDAPLTSTSVRNSSKDFLSNISRTKEVEPESSKFTNQLEVFHNFSFADIVSAF